MGSPDYSTAMPHKEKVFSISWEGMSADGAVKNPQTGLIVHRDLHHPDYPEHKHNDFDEIVIIEGGTAVNSVNGHDLTVTAGEVFVLQKNTRHSYHHTCDLSLINLCFRRSALAPFMAGLNQSPGFQALFTVQPALKKKGLFLGRLHLDTTKMAVLNNLISQLENELQQPRPANTVLSVALFAQIVANLSLWYEKPKSTKKADTHVLHLGKAVSYIENHFDEPIETETLAKISTMSLRSFYRAFNEAFGESPSNYINRIRIRSAIELMNDPRKNITDIAFETGFSDSNYFARAFRKFMGQSPTAFRQKIKQ